MLLNQNCIILLNPVLSQIINEVTIQTKRKNFI